MAFLKINSYTRVLDDGKGSADKYAKLLNESSLAKSSNFLKEKKDPKSMLMASASGPDGSPPPAGFRQFQ